MWLNDNSDGPEWTIVEIEKPRMKLFTNKEEPTYRLNHAIEQVNSWRRYFDETPSEKGRIFGAVARFRYIIVAGTAEDCSTEKARKWRIFNNKISYLEIRSSNTFTRALEILQSHPNEFWSFAENPTSLSPSKLKKFWKSYRYMDDWRIIIK